MTRTSLVLAALLLASPAFAQSLGCESGWTLVWVLGSTYSGEVTNGLAKCAEHLKDPITPTAICSLPDGRHWVAKNGYCNIEDAPK